MRSLRWFAVSLVLLSCGDTELRPSDAGRMADAGAADGGPVDAARPDGGDEACTCPEGPHTENIYLMSAEGEVWRFDPRTNEFAFVVGPVCAGQSPFSMAVDLDGVAWINIAESRAVLTLDLLDPGPCTESPYVRTDPDYGLFGTSFASRSALDVCAELYVMTYSGDGAFDEGTDLGKIGVIDPESGELTTLTNVDFDGGELTGTGDGRLFAFTGVDPVKLVEYERASGAVLATTPLEGVRKTNASAIAFFGGDLFIFTEATPAECQTCLEATCADALVSCEADAVCVEHLECVLATPEFSDECGGGLSEAMVSCLTGPCEVCGRISRARTSRVIRYDLDGSEGGGGAEIVPEGPIRVVGAASSPCVPTELI